MFGMLSVHLPRREIRHKTRKTWGDKPASSSQLGMNGARLWAAAGGFPSSGLDRYSAEALPSGGFMPIAATALTWAGMRVNFPYLEFLRRVAPRPAPSRFRGSLLAASLLAEQRLSD